MNNTNPLFLYFGRHKCATRYITTVLVNYAKYTGLNFYDASLPEPRSLDWYFKNYKGDVDIMRAAPYTNTIRETLEKYSVKYRGFHVVRDPRDMIISAYFSHCHSHPTRYLFQQEYFERVRSIPQEDGISEEIELSGWHELNDMMTWDTDAENILELKFEDIVTEPLKIYTKVLEFGGFVVKEEILTEILNQLTFKSLSGGRSPGEEDAGHHFRKGISGDWKNYFSENHVRQFNEKYSRLLEKYGYN